MPEDPRDHAVRKFDTDPEPPLWSALDVIVRYCTDPPLAVQTLLDAVRPAASIRGARICELGPGTGWLLEDMQAAFPDARYHALDLSHSVVRNMHQQFGGNVRTVLGDMERLPFRPRSLDCIVTCWTLYFMRDLDAALAGMRDCIRPGGLFVTATVAPDHMLEFDQAAAEAVRHALGRERDPDISVNFDVSNALAPLQRAFDHVDVREYHGELVLPDVATAMILWPGYGPQLTNPEEDAAARTEFESLVAAEIAREGQWRTRRHDAVFVAKVSPNL
jgi:SAM-dependent methyltransferase